MTKKDKFVRSTGWSCDPITCKKCGYHGKWRTYFITLGNRTFFQCPRCASSIFLNEKGGFDWEVNIEVEVGRGIAFEIVEEVDGFWIDYSEELKDLKLKGWKPLKSDLKEIVGQTKKVMKELRIRAPHLGLYLVHYGLGGSRPTCFVDKRREIICLHLPIVFVGRHFHIDVPPEDWDHLFYHELTHAKDVLEKRFPSSGFINVTKNPELGLITSLSHFSIEGRLEKWGKPHRSRQQVMKTEYSWAKKWVPKKFITRELFQMLCDKLWGKEVTFQELQSLLKNMDKSGNRHPSPTG